MIRFGRRRAIALGLGTAIVAGALVLPGAASAAKKTSKVSTMTRNLYLGADLTPALLAPDAPSAFLAAGDIYNAMLETNFAARSRVLAREIANARPDLIGLQEVALWRRGQRGAPDGPATPSTEVVVDFLDDLTKQLDDLGLDYKVVVRQQEADIELPVDRTDDATTNPEFDGRLTMHDVILAKDRLRLSNAQGENYAATLSAPSALGPIPVLRGYTAVDVRKGKNKRKKNGKKIKPPKFRFINTHLEAFTSFHRQGQAQELVAAGGVSDTRLPIILVGDLNSDPDDDSPGQPIPPGVLNSAAYETVVNGGFTDRGVTVPTCCHADGLRNDPPAAFDSRIDHVMSKGTVDPLSATLIGVDPALRTPTALWPSDHGGVVARLKVR